MLEPSSNPRQQAKPYPPRRKRPELPPESPGPSGATRWLAGIITVLVLMIVVARFNSSPETPAPAVDTQPVAPPPPPPRPLPPPRLPPPAPVAGATPTVDLMVRLEAHRRIVRAGSMVYLDSLLIDSDSVLRRWPVRPREVVTVAVVQDSLSERAGTVGAAALREAFGRWSGLQLGGLQFGFISDTASANIVVQWIAEFEPVEKRTGQTDLTIASDGAIHNGRIQLALADPSGKRMDRTALLTVALHEVGHVLGLGHSNQVTDVMYHTPRSPDLSERDRRTAELIYGLPPGSVKGGN